MNLRIVNYTVSIIESEDLEDDGIIPCKRRGGVIAFDKCVEIRISPNCDSCKYFNDEYFEMFKYESKEKRKGNTLKPVLTKDESSELWDEMRKILSSYNEEDDNENIP